MKHYFYLILIASFTLITNCSVLKYPELPTPDITSDKMKIKGIGSLSNKKPITYGPYYTKNHDRGYSHDNTSLFLPSLTDSIQASKKTSFIQVIPNGNEARVNLIERLKREGLHVLETLDIAKTQNNIHLHQLLGKIKPIDGTENEWSFEIDFLKQTDHISAKDLKGNELIVNYFKNREQGTRERIVYGADIALNNKIVGAYRKGKDGVNEVERSYAWINNNLSNNYKLIVSSLITVLSSREAIDIYGKL